MYIKALEKKFSRAFFSCELRVTSCERMKGGNGVREANGITHSPSGEQNAAKIISRGDAEARRIQNE